MTSRLAFLSFLAVPLLACVGPAFVEGSGGSGGSASTGGSTSTGGQTGSSSSSGSTTSGNSTCPKAEPQDGATCSASMLCHYPSASACCADDAALCNGKTWSISSGTCSANACPAQPPPIGSDCTCAPATCNYDMCADQLTTFHYTCQPGTNTWARAPAPCNVSCGSTLCSLGPNICVDTGSRACAPNPCQGSTSCDGCLDTYCATVLPGSQCKDFSKGQLTCGG